MAVFLTCDITDLSLSGEDNGSLQKCKELLSSRQSGEVIMFLTCLPAVYFRRVYIPFVIYRLILISNQIVLYTIVPLLF